MRQGQLIALMLVPALLASACVTTTRTTTWSDSYGGDWIRYGHVESIRETVTRSEGNPAAGAAVGAVIGGILGSAIGGHTRYDRWGYGHYHASAAGAVVGAVGGAAVGAAASQGSSEERTYEVFIRFDDGVLERYVYRGFPPFQVGDTVSLTPRGLARA